MIVDINLDSVVFEKQTIQRPSLISRTEWENLWSNVAVDRKVEDELDEALREIQQLENEVERLEEVGAELEARVDKLEEENSKLEDEVVNLKEYMERNSD